MRHNLIPIQTILLLNHRWCDRCKWITRVLFVGDCWSVLNSKAALDQQRERSENPQILFEVRLHTAVVHMCQTSTCTFGIQQQGG